MMNYHAISLTLLSLSLGACASTPMRYYTLTPPLSGTATMPATCCSIHLRRVAVPPDLDRADIVTRSGADQLVVHGNEVWLAPLGEEIRSALGAEINRHLSTITAVTAVSSVRDFAVWVNITRFDSVLAQYVVVTADWRIQSSTQQASTLPKAISTRCAATVRIQIADGLAALVQGYQQAIAQIAEQIATGVEHAGEAMPDCKEG